MQMTKYAATIYKLMMVLMLTVTSSGAFINAQCNPSKYAAITNDAKKFLDKGELLMAKNNFESAVIFACSQTEIVYIETEIDKIFNQIDQMRRIADSTAMSSQLLTQRYFANDLAYKAQLALSEGDCSTSFRLLEFASVFADSLNEKVLQTNSKLFYQHTLSGNGVNPVWRERLKYGDIVTPDGRFLILVNGTTVLKRGVDEIFADTITVSESPIRQISTDSNGTTIVLLLSDSLIQICKKSWSEDYQSNFIIKNKKKSIRLTGVHLSDDGIYLAVSYENSDLALYKVHGGFINNKDYSPVQLSLSEIGLEEKYLHDTNGAIFFKGGVIINYDEYAIDVNFAKNYIHYFDSIATPRNDYSYQINGFELLNEQHSFSVEINDILVKRPSFYPENLEVYDIKNGAKIGIIQNSDYGRLFIINKRTLGIFKENYITIVTVEQMRIKILDSIFVDNRFAKFSWSAELNLLAYTRKDGDVIIYDFSNKKIKNILHVHDNVYFLKFINDGKSVMTDDYTIWHLEDFNFNLTEIDDSFANTSMGDMCFSPTGKHLANSNIISGVKLINIFNYSVEKTVEPSLTSFEFMEFLDEDHILGLGMGLIVKEISTGKTIDSISGIFSNSHKIALSKKKNFIAVAGNGSYDDNLKLFKIEKNYKLTLIKKQNSSELSFFKFDFSNNEEQMAVLSWDGLHIISISDFSTLKFLPSYKNDVRILKYTPDGKHLAILHKDTMKLLSTNSWEVESKFNLPTDRLGTISPCGRYYLYIDHSNFPEEYAKKSIKFISLKNGKIFTRIDVDLGSISDILLSPRGSELAVMLDGKTTQLFNLYPDKVLNISKIKNVELRLPWFSVEEIEEFELEKLLDIKQSNEEVLKSRYDIEQILAFADMFLKKMSNDSFLESDYQRALRLYQYCLNSTMHNTLVKEKILELKTKYNALKNTK